jgi:putative colanic acid biosynthesis glycosyltransferase
MRDAKAAMPPAKSVLTSGSGGLPSSAPHAAPLISIITVNLNDARGLRRTAASVAAQTVTDFEWLIIDGGSTDGSVAVIREFHAHVATWSSRPDRGVYDAMNRGLAFARGEYVIFMNGGDRFADEYALQPLLRAIRGPAAPDLVFAATILEWPSGAQLYRAPRSPERFVRFGMPAYHQAIAIRRRLHLARPYDLGMSVSAEYAAIAGMLTAGASWQLVDAPLATRRCDPTNLSERRTLQRFAEFARIQRSVLRRAWPAVALSLARQMAVHVVYLIVRARLWPGSRRPGASLGWRLLQKWLASG